MGWEAREGAISIGWRERPGLVGETHRMPLKLGLWVSHYCIAAARIAVSEVGARAVVGRARGDSTQL
jgi:hypothetical protein